MKVDCDEKSQTRLLFYTQQRKRIDAGPLNLCAPMQVRSGQLVSGLAPSFSRRHDGLVLAATEAEREAQR